MNRITGERLVSGSAAYVPQQAWIRNQTLRQNILFNKPMERDFYELVIDACALPPDIAHLPGGDQTEIGEKVRKFKMSRVLRISSCPRQKTRAIFRSLFSTIAQLAE